MMDRDMSKIMEEYDELIDLGLYEDALKLMDEALEIDPDNAQVFNDQAVVYTRLDRNGEALASYRKSLELDGNNKETLSNMGFFYQKLEKYEALSNKAATLHQLGLFEEAIDTYRKILGINPENVNALINLSVTCYTLREYDIALRFIERALSIDPYNKIAIETRNEIRKMV